MLRTSMVILTGAAWLMAPAAQAQQAARSTTAATATASSATADIRALYRSSAFRTAQQSLDRDFDRIINEVITLTEIPAPPFKEAARAQAYMEMLRAAGLQDVEMDAEGNVMGIRRGRGTGPMLVVAAHLDTVFPEGTPVTVRREGDRLSAPGIGDDTSSLPVLIAYVRAMDAANIQTENDILFVGNVGEEGPGNLRGTRYLFTQGKYKDRIGQFISIEPGRDRITNGGVGSIRYHVRFTGPGGHSFGAFGLVNPAYAMANAITEFARMPVPTDPKTTFNVGIVEGGTSVNSIPFETAMTVDMRSVDATALTNADTYLKELLPRAVAQENAARSTAQGEIAFVMEPLGHRPVGQTATSVRLVQLAHASISASGGSPSYESSSTDANLPMSLGIPAITLGSGFATQRAHALDESLLIDRPNTLRYMAMNLATIITAAGGRAR